jgi:hypothetical protein
MSEVKSVEVIYDERINIKAKFLIPFKNGVKLYGLTKNGLLRVN